MEITMPWLNLSPILKGLSEREKICSLRGQSRKKEILSIKGVHNLKEMKVDRTLLPESWNCVSLYTVTFICEQSVKLSIHGFEKAKKSNSNDTNIFLTYKCLFSLGYIFSSIQRATHV